MLLTRIAPLAFLHPEAPIQIILLKWKKIAHLAKHGWNGDILNSWGSSQTNGIRLRI